MNLDDLPEWGAASLVTSKRRRLRTRELPPTVALAHVNFLVLGPAGVGKSSLVHTTWRALTGSATSDPELLNRLGLSLNESKLRAKHGTTSLSSYALQRSSETGCGIHVQDTKGHQFFDDAERAFAERLVHGHVKDGSTLERESLYFWALVSRAGLGRFVRHAELASAPHALVLVFDVTLRSFAKLLDEPENSVQLACYRKVARHARDRGLATFVVLTHVDVYEKNVAFGETKDEAPRRVGEAAADTLLALRTRLALAFADHLVPTNRIFPIANYNAAANDHDDTVELAALELLEAVVDAAEAHLVHQCSKKDDMCLVS